MLPISAESRIVIDSSAARSPGSGARLWNSASAISETAPPPTPLNSATICGIAVIFTERAPTTPITAPIAIAERDPAVVAEPVLGERDRDRERHPGGAEQVPLPRALRRGEEAEREDEGHDRDQVEQVGRRLAHSRLPGRALLEHLEHPVGDDEAADDVRRPEHDRAEADDLGRACPPRRGPRRGSRRRGRSRGSRSCRTSAACAASSAPSRSPRSRGRSRERGSSARRRAWRPSRPSPRGRATQAPAVISSSKSSVSRPSGARWRSRAVTLRE